MLIRDATDSRQTLKSPRSFFHPSLRRGRAVTHRVAKLETSFVQLAVRRTPELPEVLRPRLLVENSCAMIECELEEAESAVAGALDKQSRRHRGLALIATDTCVLALVLGEPGVKRKGRGCRNIVLDGDAGRRRWNFRRMLEQ